MNWKRITVLASICVLASLILIFRVTINAQSNRSRIASSSENPYDRQVNEQIQKLKDPSPSTRASAATSLGFLRAYSASGALVQALKDIAPEVRREAVMALAWCGGRAEVSSLLVALDDADWSVRQAATVTLENLTGMDFPFDGLADLQIRRQQAARWRTWWAKASQEPNPSEVMALLGDKDLEKQLRGVRALGAIGNVAAAPKIAEILKPYMPRADKQNRVGYWEGGIQELVTDTEKHLAEACIRSLGRLRAPESLPVLIGLLEKAQWGRFAADALGDFGSPEAVGPLIAAYPRYSRNLEEHVSQRKPPELCPADDCISFGTEDRMFETPYAIMQSLSRLPLDQHLDELRKIATYIVANIPSDWDGGIIYQPEAYQPLTAFLLDKVNLRQAACDAAFQAASESDKWFSARVIEEQTRAMMRRQRRPEQDDANMDEEGGPAAPRNTRAQPNSLKAERTGPPLESLPPEKVFFTLATHFAGDVPFMAPWLPCLCSQSNNVPRLLGLLDHENGWIRINAVKALIFADAKDAVEPIAKKLAASQPEAEYGFSGVLEQEEYQDPAPRWRDALMLALAHFQAKQYDDVIIRILEDDRNVVDTQYAAAQALDKLDTPKAIAALKRAEADHPFQSVRLVAREALWRRGIKGAEVNPPVVAPPPVSVASQAPNNELPSSYVFIRGENKPRSNLGNEAGMDGWRVTYTTNNASPTYREGRNLYILTLAGGEKKVTPLTNFDSGFVADCEVSWDGKKIIFARRRNNDGRNYATAAYSPAQLRKPGEFELDGKDDPWWHVWEINVDGTDLHQITRGPYHDVQPAYLPDGRIVFSSSRLGLRDEYHMFRGTGLAVMNSDGSDIRIISQNQGGDREPAVLPDGRVVFNRLDVFYSRLKTEMTLQTAYPDGTHNVALYGPERRPFWADVNRERSFWSMLPGYYSGEGLGDDRNRVLKLTQPQGLPDGRVVAVSGAGLFVCGPGSSEEWLVPTDRKWAVTSPFPIGDGKKVVAAASVEQFKIGNRIIEAGTPEMQQVREKQRFGYQLPSAANIDLGLYIIDLASGEMTLLYNDPNFAEFEPRPIVARPLPPVLSESHNTWSDTYTARLFTLSAFYSRHDRVRTRGKLLRVIEGQPYVTRRETNKNVHANPEWRWKNHGGTLARVLGTVPLAADGSFYVEVPGDRLLQLQVLDSDRQVLGNETFWSYARPGETKGCVGCHEPQDTTVGPSSMPLASKMAPLATLPHGGEFTYRAKVWLKGGLPDQAEERLRTVRAVNLIGRQ